MTRVLTFNSHETYIHNLARVGYPMDVVCDLPGHHLIGWDHRMRPLPNNARVIGLSEALTLGSSYDCIVGHTLTDLLAVKAIVGPRRVLVFHSSLAGRAAQEKSAVDPEAFRSAVERYLSLTGATTVMISPMKAASWGLPAVIIPGAVDAEAYGPWRGEVASGLRVANHVTAKAAFLDWELHQQSFGEDCPCRLVGENPDMPGVEPAPGWARLKELFASHRFFVHTANPKYEDGYNLASLEAMATGMPIVCSKSSSCPIEDGVSGIVSNDPGELREGAQRLLSDFALAQRMGEAAREVAIEEFPIASFTNAWRHVIEGAAICEAPPPPCEVAPHRE
ncbi:MAG: glycosyltransferase family 4 protein [Myxococcales bacterium]|nr:glycosyltransferase family 4 protein [Myxococcales bacterium]